MLSSGYGTEYGPSYGVFGDENPYAPLLWNHDHVTPHHRVVVNTTWDIPVGRGRRYLSQAPGIVDKVLGGVDGQLDRVLPDRSVVYALLLHYRPLEYQFLWWAAGPHCQRQFACRPSLGQPLVRFERLQDSGMPRL